MCQSYKPYIASSRNPARRLTEGVAPPLLPWDNFCMNWTTRYPVASWELWTLPCPQTDRARCVRCFQNLTCRVFFIATWTHYKQAIERVNRSVENFQSNNKSRAMATSITLSSVAEPPFEKPTTSRTSLSLDEFLFLLPQALHRVNQNSDREDYVSTFQGMTLDRNDPVMRLFQ